MSDTAPLYRGAARLAARLAILGALLFLGVAGSLQLVRDDLAWQQATLSRGPYVQLGTPESMTVIWRTVGAIEPVQ